jgi:hypothetical protein
VFFDVQNPKKVRIERVGKLASVRVQAKTM